MVTKTYLPPASQRPKIISRFEISEVNQVPRAEQDTGVVAAKTQVVQRTPNSSDIRFPLESQVEQFRGDVQGRGLRETAVPEQLSDLPKRVLPFNTPKYNAFYGRLNSAESAALGLQPSNTDKSTEPSPQSPMAENETKTQTSDISKDSKDKVAEEKVENRPREESKPNGDPLSDDDLRKVEELKKRDKEVRQHEQAHVTAGGQHIRGGIKYEYTQGPNGKRYVIGGEVNIDLSSESTPEATISKMQQVRQAALAPAQPSGADRAAAAAATQKEQQARSELANQRKAEAQAQAAKRSEVGKEAVNTEKPDNQIKVDTAEKEPSIEAIDKVPSTGNVTQKRLKGFESYPLSNHESHPLSSNFESHPLSSNFESHPLSSSFESHPLSSNHESHPLSSNFESHPLSSNFESHPLSSNFESHPLSSNHESHPLSSNFESHPLSSNHESHPLSSNFESHPLSSNFESHPLSSNFESHPLSSNKSE